MNIQTLPRKETIVKRAIIPKLDYLLFADYSQIEMRILAYYMACCGDKSMVQILSDPTKDLHTESAMGAFLLEREPHDWERQLGKNLNFSMVFGGGKPAVLRYLTEAYQENPKEVPKPSWAAAGRLLNNFHRRWPGIGVVIALLEATYRERGYVKTIAGARLHPTSNHKLLNAVVQGSAAEELRAALRVCHNKTRNMSSHLVCNVHDEIAFDVREDELGYLTEWVPVWMDAFPEVSEVVPITVDLAFTTTNWADKHKLGA
jgi:DNA polymerase-1